MTTPTMTIDGVEYVEAKPRDDEDACAQCAFANRRRDCERVCCGAAEAAFGGECAERDVIYLRKE